MLKSQYVVMPPAFDRLNVCNIKTPHFCPPPLLYASFHPEIQSILCSQYALSILTLTFPRSTSHFSAILFIILPTFVGSHHILHSAKVNLIFHCRVIDLTAMLGCRASISSSSERQASAKARLSICLPVEMLPRRLLTHGDVPWSQNSTRSQWRGEPSTSGTPLAWGNPCSVSRVISAPSRRRMRSSNRSQPKADLTSSYC